MKSGNNHAYINMYSDWVQKIECTHVSHTESNKIGPASIKKKHTNAAQSLRMIWGSLDWTVQESWHSMDAVSDGWQWACTVLGLEYSTALWLWCWKWLHQNASNSYETLCCGRMGPYVKYKVRETKGKICIVMLHGCKLTEIAHAIAYTRAKQKDPQR
jgi:hypothetical protein